MLRCKGEKNKQLEMENKGSLGLLVKQEQLEFILSYHCCSIRLSLQPQCRTERVGVFIEITSQPFFPDLKSLLKIQTDHV